MSAPKRLIEVDLPVREISAHARREKSIRHGHISTLHIWWARRPLAACRAVILATLIPDPADDECPPEFLKDAAEALRFRYASRALDDPLILRRSLLDFIAEFANWDYSSDPGYMSCARALVRAAYPQGPPLLVDPFAGGGTIPLEALRLGADALSNDLNPVSSLVQRAVLEYLPRYGDDLVDGVARWGQWLAEEAQLALREYYPLERDGAESVGYLWCRTIRCEGPSCGAEVPLFRSLWLSKKGRDSEALRMLVQPDGEIKFDLVKGATARDVGAGTSKGGSATCPRCRFTTPVGSVRKQLRERRGGSHDARLVAVRTSSGSGRGWRIATDEDHEAAVRAASELARRIEEHSGPLSLVPDEPLPPAGTLGFRVQGYGLKTWGDLFTPRQALSLATFADLLRTASMDMEPGLQTAVKTVLGLAIDRLADFNASLCVLNSTGGRGLVHVFGRQALPMVWDFMETNPFNDVAANWESAVSVFSDVAATERWLDQAATVVQGNALELPLPSGIANAVVTDPPYYDAVPYAALSDFFYVWLRRSIGAVHPELLGETTSPKSEEIIVDPIAAGPLGEPKSGAFFEEQMSRAFGEARRVLAPDEIAVIVFAHKSTEGWEAMLQALLEAGWTVTGSWPIDTERPGRLRAQGSAALASSIHIVCRPRPDAAPVGSWRDVRPEIERRVSEWLPRLANEGVEGADAIFACIGPALEAYSRYRRVETAAGDPVPLSTPADDPEAPALLPTVWAAIARTALARLFEGAETDGYEEDARLTALWLWTLKARVNGTASPDTRADNEGEEDASTTKQPRGLALDYDTARKLAQALGVHLEALEQPGGIVEMAGSTARLRLVAERRRFLLGAAETPKRRDDGTLFDAGEALGTSPVLPGATTLDRLHQAMILFGDGRSGALRRLLSEPGYASDEGFMRLARSLSALYPGSSQEKRWLDGVLATRVR